MVGSEGKTHPGIPPWQKTQSVAADTQCDATESATLEQARKFLQDPVVKHGDKERSIDFLGSKGVSREDTVKLLAEKDATAQVPNIERQSSDEQRSPRAEAQMETQLYEKSDRPLIITYPEYLVKSARPPPLITPDGVLTTLYTCGILATLVYGTSRYILKPMVECLTDARISLQDTANENLCKLVAKLETVVSSTSPPKYTDDIDDSSSCSDPTELFHRDFGVQTSMPSSPARISSPTQYKEPAAEQERKLTQLADSIRSVSTGFKTQSEDYADIGTMLQSFQEDLNKLSYPSVPVSFSLYGQSTINEPDDEIKQAKDNIRRVKGALLSTRNFPGSVR